MPHARAHTRRKTPKRVLALPDLEHAKSAVLSSLTSRSGQRTCLFESFIVKPVRSMIPRRALLGCQECGSAPGTAISETSNAPEVDCREEIGTVKVEDVLSGACVALRS